MILLGIGANLPGVRHGTPLATCEAALADMEKAGIRVAGHSRWYRSAPVPASSQPWYVNGVARVETGLGATALLTRLHRIEADLGRQRGEPNAARVIDLDILDMNGLVTTGEDGPVLPHPRMHQRAFVLLPLAEVAPGWRHPVSGLGVEELLARLPAGQTAEPMEISGKPSLR